MKANATEVKAEIKTQKVKVKAEAEAYKQKITTKERHV
jgi:hypothetical protein